VVSRFLPTLVSPTSPKHVSEIYCYNSGLGFAALEAGEIDSSNLAPNYTSNRALGMARRLKGNIAQYNEEEEQLQEIYVERCQSVRLLSSVSVSNLIYWLKFFGYFCLKSDA